MRSTKFFQQALILIFALTFSLAGMAEERVPSYLEKLIKLNRPKADFIPGMETAEVAAKVRSNYRGSAYDGKIAVGRFSSLGGDGFQLSDIVLGGDNHDVNIAKKIFKDDLSREFAPLIYLEKDGSIAKSVLKKVLIDNGLLFAPTLPEKTTGFNVVPKAPYRLSVSIEDYYDEAYAGDQSAGGRLWQQMTSNTNAYYSEEMLQRGYAIVTANYMFILKNQESGETIKAMRVQEQMQVGLSKDAAGNIQTSMPYSEHQMFANGLKQFLRPLIYPDQK